MEISQFSSLFRATVGHNAIDFQTFRKNPVSLKQKKIICSNERVREKLGAYISFWAKREKKF